MEFLTAVPAKLLDYGALGILCLVSLYLAYRLGTELIAVLKEARARDDAKNAQIIQIKDASEDRAWAANDRAADVNEKVGEVMQGLRSDLLTLPADVSEKVHCVMQEMRLELAQLRADLKPPRDGV